MTLELAGVSKIVEGEPWLIDIDLVLDDGLNLLVGPSRAGKTTLMRIAAGLDAPSSGRVVEDGRDPSPTAFLAARRVVAASRSDLHVLLHRFSLDKYERTLAS